MKSLCALLVAIMPALAMALPAEDHWGADPDSPFAKELAEATALIEAEHYKEALPLLEQLAEQARGNADVFNLLGFAYRKTGDLENSAPAYERALFLDPDHVGALEYQGELFLTLDNIEGAEANLEKLMRACAWPCEEAEELTAAIAAWRAVNTSSPQN
ncbi:MAG: tetratricopeptide repeat protein [Pseudomonadota bacterium]